MSDPFILFRAAAFITLIALLFAGVYLVRNFARIFGKDPDMPHETASSRTYYIVVVVLVWIHGVVLSGLYAFGWH